MPEPTKAELAGTAVPVRNPDTGALETVAPEDFGKTGQEPTGVGTTSSVSGVSIARNPAATAVQVSGGATPGNLQVDRALALQAERRALARTAKYRGMTYVEGIVDAATFGLAHDRSDFGNLRRGENATEAFLGQLTGLLLPTGPGKVFSGGKAAGEAVSKALLGEIRVGGIAGRAISEGTAMAALSGAQAVGTHLGDTIIQDKPFAMEAVLAETGVGALMGAGFGAAGGALEKLLGRGTGSAVRAQGGLLDSASPESGAVHSSLGSAVDSMNQALERHSMEIGALRALKEEGHAGVRLYDIAKRDAALSEATAARDKFVALNRDAALSGADPKAYAQFRDALEDYQLKLGKLDMVAYPTEFERLPSVEPRPYDPERNANPLPGVTDFDALQAQKGVSMWPGAYEKGGPTAAVPFVLDDLMTPERRAAYERLHGRPYEEAGVPLEGEENLGGKITPTSERPTGAGKAVRIAEAETNPRMTAQGGAVTGEMSVAQRPTAEIPAPGPGVLSPEPLAPEVPAGARVLMPKAAPGNRLNEAYSNQEKVLLPNGRFLPDAPVSRAENALDFARFRDKMADDTMIRKARKEASLKAFRDEQAGVRAAQEAHAQRGRDILGKINEQFTAERAQAETGRRAVQRFLDGWYERGKSRSRMTPGDEAAAAIRGVTERITEETEGRLDSAAALDHLKTTGVEPARTALGGQLDQIFATRSIARALTSTGEAATETTRRGILEWIGRRTAGRAGAKITAGVVGGTLGGPLGFVAGVYLADRLMGATSRVASAAGRVKNLVVTAAKAMVERAPKPAQALVNASRNTPVAYGPGEPIRDPVERIRQLKDIAARPDALHNLVLQQMGDFALLHPDLARQLAESAEHQITQLALRAPPVGEDYMGRPIPPTEGALRRFLEFENAVHNMPEVLKALGRGNATPNQIDALRISFPVVHAQYATEVLRELANRTGDNAPGRLHLKALERALGQPLTPSSTPEFALRNMEAWAVGNAAMAQELGGGGKMSLPGTESTPATAASTPGRAPGN